MRGCLSAITDGETEIIIVYIYIYATSTSVNVREFLRLAISADTCASSQRSTTSSRRVHGACLMSAAERGGM